MRQPQLTPQRYKPEEYFALEDRREVRHEYSEALRIMPSAEEGGLSPVSAG